MADSESINKPIKRNLASLFDCVEQISDRRFAIAFLFLKLDLPVALGKRENVGGLLDPLFLKEKLDLLFTKSIDIEGAARAEQLEMLDLLVGTREFARAAGTGALLSGRRLLAYDVGVQIARAFFRKMIRLGVLRTFVHHDIDDL